MAELQIDAETLLARLRGTSLDHRANELLAAVLNQEHALKHGHLEIWEQALRQLPVVDEARWYIREGVMCIEGDFDPGQESTLRESLTALQPWRKGPYRIGPITVDTEWRSDWKWNRIEPYLHPLDGHCVLDVGCGSGYHMWRMRAAGSSLVLGIDPSLLYLKQFDLIQHFVNDPAVLLLPLTMDALPQSLQVFDTVFSMGVLYHRRDHMQHLAELRQAMRHTGKLVLETLVIPGQDEDSLLINDRYANMRNIYELPTVSRLESWLAGAGFSKVHTVSVEKTSRREQRRTEWMQSHSLAQALDPENPELTIEGYPRPLRAITLADY